LLQSFGHLVSYQGGSFLCKPQISFITGMLLFSFIYQLNISRNQLFYYEEEERNSYTTVDTDFLAEGKT